jgi:hypothetical protein
MPEFPLTFRHAGRTFSVVTDGDPCPGPDTMGRDLLFVRIVGTRGLHELGRLLPGESTADLELRIRRWYDDQLAIPAVARSS